jgi:steroid 5-alpha reductase family enzyme
MTFSLLMLWSAAAVVVLMVGTWVVSLPLKNTGIVDSVWSVGFIVVAVLALLTAGGDSIRGTLVLVLTFVWGARLSIHITLRNRGRGEDPRYAAWRREHGDRWPLRSLITVFLLQGVLLWIISLPLQVAVGGGGTDPLTGWDYLGLTLWMAGFLIEATADAQLASFRARAGGEGQVLTSGLRRYSRHPHYFGEALLWWGFFFFAVPVSAGWWAVISPLLLTFLVRWVSGVPMSDRLLAERPGYKDYAARTSPFIPLPPKRS